MLADEITADLRAIRAQRDRRRRAQTRPQTSRARLASKGIDYGTITAHPDGTRRHHRRCEASTPTCACGRSSPRAGPSRSASSSSARSRPRWGCRPSDPDLAAAHGGRTRHDARGHGARRLASTRSRRRPPPTPTADPDGDGVANEIPHEPRRLHRVLPAQLLQARASGEQTRDAQAGRLRVRADRLRGLPHPEPARSTTTAAWRTWRRSSIPSAAIFNGCSHRHARVFTATDDGSGLPDAQAAVGQPLSLVRNIFTDFKRHDLGPNFHERNYDGTIASQFMTEPLWGVGTTAPYGHDGRSVKLEEVILRHGGEAAGSARLPSASSRRRAAQAARVPPLARALPAGRHRLEPRPGRPQRDRLPAERPRQHQADRPLQRPE